MLRAGVVGARRDPGASPTTCCCSRSPAGGDEAHADLAQPAQPADDGGLLGRRAAVLPARARERSRSSSTSSPTSGATSSRPNATSTLAVVRSRRSACALRDQLAPNVILAYHMSGWGTKHDIVYEKPPDATVRAYAAQSAAFYRSLHAQLRRRRSRTSPIATPASTRRSAATRTRGSSRPTSAGTCSTRRRSCSSRACGWSRGRSRSATR